jgi:hypothetical protein
MVPYPEKPLPSWLPRVKQPPLRLDFGPLSGTFVTDHSSKTAVSITRVIGSFGFEALIFRTRLHEDLDGAPRSYAPPISVGPSMLASVVWKWKEGVNPHQTGCSTCSSSPPEAFDERRHALPRIAVECAAFRNWRRYCCLTLPIFWPDEVHDPLHNSYAIFTSLL